MKTTFQYDHYFAYEELMNNVSFFLKTYPGLIKKEELCTTHENRKQIALTLTNLNQDPLSKPALYVDGNTHAGEVTGSMAAMHTMDYLLTNYQTDDKIKALLDNYTVYIIPRVSPDGAETYLKTPYGLRSVNIDYRKENEGLKEEDIDNDGAIRMMRVKSATGCWKIDKDNPDLMQFRQPDDTEGTYYDIYTEGLIESYDGVNFKIAEPDWGLDFNRNYPFGWFSEYRQPGAGKYPLSNPENKAVVDFVLAHPNIGGVLTHHTSGGVIVYPPGTRPEKTAFKEDMEIFKAIGKMGTQEMGYETINIFDHFLLGQEAYSSGAFDDWCFQDQGIYAYTVELWDLQKRAGIEVDWNVMDKADIDTQLSDFKKVYDWVKANAPEKFKSWTPFTHPQLGQVEIGGFDYKFLYQNPPFEYLKQEVEKATRFTLRFVKALPKLIIDSIETKEISSGIYQVDAYVSNAGFMPTYLSKEAVKLLVDQKISASLTGGEIINGTPEIQIKGLGGYSLKKTGSTYYGNLGTFTSEPCNTKLTWMVKAPKGSELSFTLFQQKSGSVSQTIVL